MDQILLYLMGRTNRVHVADARDKDQEWGVSDWATYILVVCYQPPECHQYDNGAFRRRQYQDGFITLTKWSCAELSLKCLKLVGKLGPPYQYHQMQLYRYWMGYSIQVTNVVKDLFILMDRSFSPFIHFREAASEA